MPQMANSQYNNPAFAQMGGNIASMFAPPSGADLAGYANAAATRARLGMLQQMYANPDDPNFDRRMIVLGNETGTNSIAAQNQNDATARANNLQTNQYGLMAKLYGTPVGAGEVMPAVPQDMADKFGVQSSGTTGLPTSDTVKAAIMGQLPKPLQTEAAMQGVTPIMVANPNGGLPIMKNPQQAVVDGATSVGGMTQDRLRNAQLANVVTPELTSLLGDGKTPGTFDALASGANQALDASVPGVGSVGKILTSPAYQAAQNSLKTIVASYLYSVSGATANPGEVESLVSTLTPRFGEAPESVAAKKGRLQDMVHSIQQAAMGVPYAPGAGAAPSVVQPQNPVAPVTKIIGGVTYTNDGKGGWTY